MEILLIAIMLIICVISLAINIQVRKTIIAIQEDKQNEYIEINRRLDKEMKALHVDDEYDIDNKYRKFQSENDLYTNKKKRGI